MVPLEKDLIDPFGYADCEEELRQLRERYEDIFFDEAPFNRPSIDALSYLIIGRRGSGKTALANFFSFQKQIPRSRCLELNEPKAYHEVLGNLSDRIMEPRQLIIPHLADLWEVVVWTLILEKLKGEDEQIRALCAPREGRLWSPEGLFRQLHELVVKPERYASEALLEKVRNEPTFTEARTRACILSRREPLIVAIDTLEQYEIHNEALMNAVAALIEFAARFNSEFRDRGIHLKVFVPGEIFPYLGESILLNPLKSVRHPVYLLWGAKDLLRLICWRLFRRLLGSGIPPVATRIQDWDSFTEVHEKMWIPYFDRHINNRNGRAEETFTYVLRHTQMRPRQLIFLCNAIGNRSIAGHRFPHFSDEDLRDGIREAEGRLASEILNSYSSVYQNVALIINALQGTKMLFLGSELDKRAKETASEWQRGSYSPSAFRRLVAEIGVVGRVRHRDERSGFIDAEFEYSLPDRLHLTARDECVIHPMFYSRLNVETNGHYVVMPFRRAESGAANVYRP